MAEEAGANHNAALRRKAYVDAGREAFLDAGFGATTMSSIAARVGGSQRRGFHYASVAVLARLAVHRI